MLKEKLGTYVSDRDAQAPNPSSPAKDTILACPIIAAVNEPELFPRALDSPTQAIYLLSGNPLSLPEFISKAWERGKVCLINIDFLDGLARDRHAVEFLAAQNVAGIVSTRVDTLKAAQSLGLITIQRTFAIDTAAITAAVRSLNQFVPDAMEILPAVAAPKAVKRLRAGLPGSLCTSE